MQYYRREKKLSKKKYLKTAGLISIFAGLVAIIYFFFPVISYQIFLASSYETAHLEVPIPKRMVVNEDSGLGSLITQGISSLTSNYSDARNWYPKNASDTIIGAKVDSYLLSIPKLKIENAKVSTRDYNLDQHLVQYFGTAIPGEPGTAVIFGHSTLPSWFDPKNYKAIFATLHTIKVGDEINATIGKISYKYKIFAIVITTPEDTNILSQSYDNSYLTIVTCTPPGTIWKRLIVRAALVPPES